ncbi:hypothetical protein E4U49_001172 [Claviceps purpurea]|nr:hypothetical protein E4U49_001172 [Claviceps purpurea]
MQPFVDHTGHEHPANKMYDHSTGSQSESEEIIPMRMWSKDFLSREKTSLFMTPYRI